MAIATMTIQKSTKQVIKESQSGNELAFKELIDNHQQFAFSLAIKILLNNDLATEAVQESFIKVWKKIGLFNFKNKFTTWLYRIVVNTCYDILKAEKRRVRAHEGYIREHEISSVDNYENCDLIQKIRFLSRNLPKKQRIVFILCDLQGLTLEEAGEVLNCKKGIIKSNLFYARKNIQQKLGGLSHDL